MKTVEVTGGADCAARNVEERSSETRIEELRIRVSCGPKRARHYDTPAQLRRCDKANLFGMR
jgi:hypothetical protein